MSAHLLERFCQPVRDRYGQQVPKWVTKPISEFIRYDPASPVFRYDASGTRLQSAGEFWVDLRTVCGLVLKSLEEITKAGMEPVFTRVRETSLHEFSEPAWLYPYINE